MDSEYLPPRIYKYPDLSETKISGMMASLYEPSGMPINTGNHGSSNQGDQGSAIKKHTYANDFLEKYTLQTSDNISNPLDTYRVPPNQNFRMNDVVNQNTMAYADFRRLKNGYEPTPLPSGYSTRWSSGDTLQCDRNNLHCRCCTDNKAMLHQMYETMKQLNQNILTMQMNINNINQCVIDNVKQTHQPANTINNTLKVDNGTMTEMVLQYSQLTQTDSNICNNVLNNQKSDEPTTEVPSGRSSRSNRSNKREKQSSERDVVKSAEQFLKEHGYPVVGAKNRLSAGMSSMSVYDADDVVTKARTKEVAGIKRDRGKRVPRKCYVTSESTNDASSRKFTVSVNNAYESDDDDDDDLSFESDDYQESDESIIVPKSARNVIRKDFPAQFISSVSYQYVRKNPKTGESITCQRRQIHKNPGNAKKLI